MVSRGRVGAEGRGAVVRHALGNPELRWVLGAFLLFNVAEWASWIGLLVWGYGVGGVRGSSVIALVQLVPAAVLAAPLASLMGRLPSRGALPLGYAAQALGYLAVALALVFDSPVVVVGFTASLSALAVTLTRPTHNALLPEVSRTTGDLTAGNAASGTLEAVAAFLGPLSGGVLLNATGVGPMLVVTSALSAVSALMTARLLSGWGRRHPRVRRMVRRGEGDLHTLLRNPAARLMSVLIVAEYALVGMTDILLVVLALDVLDMADSGPGVLGSAIGLGGIAGAGLTFLLIGRARLVPPLVVGAACAGLAFALAGQPGAPVTIVLLLLAVSGAGKLLYDVASRTLIQRLLPDHLLAAMFGLQESFALTGIAAGTLAAPVLVALLGTQGAFIVAGCLMPVTVLASFPMLRRLDAATTVPMDVLALLMRVSALSVLAPRIVERLARDADAELIPAGRQVVQQGDTGTRFYVIASGRASVDIDGSPVRELGCGDWFGEIALLRDVPRTASVKALTDLSLWALDRRSFLSSLMAAPRAVELAEEHIREKYV